MDILETINKGESDTVEFKSGFNKEAIEAIVAFSNTKVALYSSVSIIMVR